jgi:hypothetical protein
MSAKKKAALPVFTERKLKLEPKEVVKVSFDLGAPKAGYLLTGGLTCVASDDEHAHIANLGRKQAIGNLRAWTGKPGADQGPTTAKSRPLPSPYKIKKPPRMTIAELQKEMKKAAPKKTTKKEKK